MKWIACLLLTMRVAHAGPSPAALAGAPPPTATRLASGVVWTTLVPGHGPRPAATDWVTFYGGGSHEPREHYYRAKSAPITNVAVFVDATTMTVGEKRRYWVPAMPTSPARVQDIELIAILGPRPPPTTPSFPAPTDAQLAPSGDRYVVVEDGKPSRGPTALADRVHFTMMAFDGEGKAIDLRIPPGVQPLGDITVAAVADALRVMAPSERRFVWTKLAGKPLWLDITMYAIEHRPQVPAPPDVARAPANATAGPGTRHVVLAPGTGEPPDAADEVTLDYTVWTTAGRTVEISPRPPVVQVAGSQLPALASHLTEMRVGERRRIWFSPAAAGYLSEHGLGAVADVKLVAIKRNLDPLPRGLRIAHADRGVQIVRGATRATLPTPIVAIRRAQLANNSVTFTGESACGVEVSTTISLAQLEARVEDAEATERVRAGRFPDAIASAARAVALAPELDELHVRLATAHVKAGQPRKAAQALAVVAARNPVWTYWQVHEQRALGLLAGEPEIKALRVRSSATIDLASTPVLVEPTGRFVAVSLEEFSWGSGDGETRIEIFEIATATIIATIPRVMWSSATGPMSPQRKAEVTRRKRQVEGWLAELGFAGAANLERATIQREGRNAPTTTTFARAKITVNPAGEVLQGATVIGHAPGLDGDLHDAYWLPTQRIMVFHWGHPGAEGCESTDPQGVEILKLR